MLVDTHVHLYHRRLAEDIDSVVERAREAGIREMILPAIDIESIHNALKLCARYDGVYAMAALHPSETKDATYADFEEVVGLCADPRIVAVGESGLDYYWDRSFDERQHDFFRRHIRLAVAADLPLILHNREASEDLVRILREEKSQLEHGNRLRGIFHCFGGPEWMVEASRELGFLLGIGGTVTFKNAGVAELVKDVPLDMLVLETDAPFLAPVPHRGQRNEPAYTRLVAEHLAAIRGVSLEQVAEATTANAHRLFGIGR
jgi:TatD DNase family protein